MVKGPKNEKVKANMFACIYNAMNICTRLYTGTHPKILWASLGINASRNSTRTCSTYGAEVTPLPHCGVLLSSKKMHPKIFL